MDTFSTYLMTRAGNTGIGPYNYVPSQGVCIVFVTLFAISTLAHIVQAVFLLRSGPGFLPEDPRISATITGPTPLIAANFVILEYIIKTIGPRYSRLSPRMYTILFCSSDAISLTIQGVGGALAAMAAGNGKDPTTGGNVMLIGIIMQMVAITVFVIFASEFLLRYASDKPLKGPADDMERHQALAYRLGMDPRMKISLYAMAFSTTCLFIRAIYRTVELTDGWNGRIISTELYFNVLDGGMVILAIFTLNIFHPGFLVLPIQRRFHQINTPSYGKA
ncbi:hypothetical protein ID866_9078 [Astraeus odoratus]|nr:hypothetical protein ID866_9078 [Astraeus odoratus]